MDPERSAPPTPDRRPDPQGAPPDTPDLLRATIGGPRVPSFVPRLRLGLFLLAAAACVAAMLAFWVLVVKSGYSDLGPDVWVSELFLRGQVGLPLSGEPDFECLYYKGVAYNPHPPLPSLLQVPVVAFVKPSLALTLVLNVLVTAANAWLTYRLLGVVGITRRAERLWLVAALLLGTVYLEASAYGPHSLSVAMMLASLNLLFAAGLRPGPKAVLAGLFLGLAFLCRQLTVVMVLFHAGVLLSIAAPSLPRRLGRVALLGLGMMPAVACYLAYNHLRFGNPLEAGYRYLNWAPGSEMLQRYGIFDLHYLPFNLTYHLLQGFHVNFEALRDGVVHTGPAQPDPYGVSLFMSSPFLLLAFAAKVDRRLRLWAWLAVLTCGLVFSMYFLNGWVQITGSRFTLDLMPVLFLLFALAYRDASDDLRGLTKWLIVYAMLMKVLAVAVKAGLYDHIYRLV
jgi:hypothetical protein